MPFDRLATVELQLVMQHCDQRTLLRLARCSRFTLAAASDPFAWRCIGHVTISSALCADAEPSALQRAWQWLRGSLGQAAAAPPDSPLGVLRGSLLRHAAAGLLLRWTGSVDATDAAGLRAALSALAALPRLRAVDCACSVFLRPDRAVAALQPAPAAGLAALDVAAVRLRAGHMRLLARQLPELRTLRCRPAGPAAACLRPLLSLPRLADLGLCASALEWDGRSADFAIVGGCGGLRRLALSGAAMLQCLPLLLAPGLRRLRELALADLRWDAEPRPPPDWANLRALRRLTLERCGRADAPLVAAAAAGAFPRLRRLRVAPAVLAHTNAWSAALCWRPLGGSPALSPLAEEISALLERRPDVRVELRVGFGMAGVSATWLLPPRAECDWLTAVPRWTDFELLHPRRHKFRSQPLLFADAELGCEAPLDPEAEEG